MASLVFTSASQNSRYWYAKSRPDKPELMEEFRDIIADRDKKDQRRKELERKSKEDYELRARKQEERRHRRAVEDRMKQLENRHKYSFWRT